MSWLLQLSTEVQHNNSVLLNISECSLPVVSSVVRVPLSTLGLRPTPCFFSILYIDIYLTELYTLYIITYIDIKYKISQILTNIHIYTTNIKIKNIFMTLKVWVKLSIVTYPLTWYGYVSTSLYFSPVLWCFVLFCLPWPEKSAVS